MSAAVSSSSGVLAGGPGAGVETIWFNGALMDVRVPGAWSEDAFSLVEVSMQRGRATGLHVDPSHETFHVLEGELLFHADGEELPGAAGSTVAMPQGVPHAFVCTSDLARFLVLNAPGGHDRFFRDGGHPAEHRDFDRAPAPDLERTAASARAHGVQLLGPPPFDGVRLRSG